MIERDDLMRTLRSLGRTVLRTAAGAVALLALALAWSLVSSGPKSGEQAADGGWGGEAIGEVRGWMSEITPIALANACGMGASSCFKCHNGNRAAAPKPEKWHTDHRSVNDSCVGCHAGNPRLIKAELAHADLVKDSRAKPERCAACHKSGNVADLVKAYKK